MRQAQLLLLIISLLMSASAATAGPAVAGGPLLSPYNPSDDFDAYPMTSAFDLDRSVGSEADWTGWVEGDLTAGNGHAYGDHSGTDWGMPNGTPLYACIDGMVTAMRDSVANDTHADTGNYIIYQGSVGSETYSVNNWHLSQYSIIPVSVGSPVTQGVQIADSNNTGNSTGPHLHFGAYVDSASGFTTCPFFNGLFTQDEYYYGDTRPCIRYVEVNTGSLNIRSYASVASDNLLTSAPIGTRFVASQRNGWYRIFLPSAPARAIESRTSDGLLTAPPDYVETGTWSNSGDKSEVADYLDDADRVTLVGAGTRRIAAGSAATAQFVPDITQRGMYEVLVTWPGAANATNVTATVNHLGGSTNVTIDQIPGVASGGTGTHADPYIINSTHWVANHTTVGGDDIWNSYLPEGVALPEEGPERIYQFSLDSSATVTVTVAHSGYPGLDVDIHLLDALSNAACLARADWSTSHTFGVGTHYISIDSYGTGATGDASATPYTITVDIDGEIPDFSWVSLGTYEFDLGQTSATGSVVIDASTAAGGFVYADAVKFAPADPPRSAWMSDSYLTILDGATDGVCCVGVQTDSTYANDAREIADAAEIPILSSPDPNARVVGKAISGQRFVCTHIYNDYYRVMLPNSADEEAGWISGEHLFVHHPERATAAIPAELTLLSSD